MKHFVRQPPADLSPAKCALLAQRILRACGVGRMAIMGDVPPPLISHLRMAGVDVREFALDELQADAAEGDDPFVVDVVLIVSTFLQPASLASRELREWAARASRSVALVLLGDAAKYESRAEWEMGFISMGLRKHPMLELVAPYSSLDGPTDLMTLLFEPVPPAAAAKYPLEALRAERDLHTDMTREAGRRSDAHMTRYAQAAQFVRPGDRVLDAACGLGYGSHILLHSTRASSFEGLDASRYAVEYATTNFSDSLKSTTFREGDAEDLSFLADSSIDFAVSVETLEHLLQPEALLQELMRVLTPGGRAYLSVPNNWADETGKDPNPFHHHVYDWTILRQQLTNCGFLLERAWTQDAGGGQRLHDAARAIREFNPEQGPQQDGEWLLVLVIKPLHVSSDELESEEEGLPNILAFRRDYANPWLVRGMIAKGLRATSSDVLSIMADTTMADSDRAGADYGAALCVACYRSLESGLARDRLELAERALAYVGGHPLNATVLRWQVSLSFVAGLLFLREGETSRAYSALEQVTTFDVLQYSPLLGTKTVAAAFQLGVVSLAASNPRDAVTWWLRAVSEAQRLIDSCNWYEVLGGDPEAPETFGLPELAGVLLDAAKAANGLRALSETGTQPGLLWQMLQQTPDAQASFQQVERGVLEEWLAQLQTGKQWVEMQAAAQDATAQQLSEAKGWLDEQYRSLINEVAQLRETNSGLSKSHEWLNDQYRSLIAETTGQGQVNAALNEDRVRLLEINGNLEQSRQWLENEYHTLIAEVSRLEPMAAEASNLKERCDALEGEVSRLVTSDSTLEESRRWLETQYHALVAEVTRLEPLAAQASNLKERCDALEGEVTRLVTSDSTLEESRRWLETQYHALVAEVTRLEPLAAQASDLKERCDAQDVEVSRLLASNSILERSRQWLDAEYHRLVSEVITLEPLAADSARLRERCAILSDEVNDLQVSNRELEASRQWLDGQYHSLAAEVGRLSDLCAEQEDSRAKLLDQYRQMECSLERIQASHSEVSDAKQRLEDEFQLLSSQNVELFATQQRCEQEIHNARARITYLETSAVRRAWARLSAAFRPR